MRDDRARSAQRRGDPLGARRVGEDQLRLGQLQRMLQLFRLPPAVEQGRDRARLEHRHVGDDPGRAVAHGDADPVALADAARDQPGASAVRQSRRARRRSAARRRRRPPRRAVERAKGLEEQRQGRREIGDDGSSLLVLADDEPPARAGDRGQHLVISPVELAGCHPSLLGVFLRHPMRRQRSRGSPCSIVRRSPVLLRLPSPTSDLSRPPSNRLVPAALVQHRLSRRNLHRLLVPAEAAQAARRANNHQQATEPR